MTVARSVADVLADHVTLEVECVDRMYLNLYVPKLVYPAGVVGFFKYHRGMPVVSGALMDPVSKTFVAGIHRYVKDHDLDLVHFVKGQRKDDVALRYLPGVTGARGSRSWVALRRRRRCSAPRGGSTLTPGPATRSW
jgi:hypothetical protein